jgi:hypothetical protein
VIFAEKASEVTNVLFSILSVFSGRQRGVNKEMPNPDKSGLRRLRAED